MSSKQMNEDSHWLRMTQGFHEFLIKTDVKEEKTYNFWDRYDESFRFHPNPVNRFYEPSYAKKNHPLKTATLESLMTDDDCYEY